MRGTPDRGVVTDDLLTLLTTAGFLMGDIVAPDEGGWLDEMGADGSIFVPYTVLTPMTASTPTGSQEDSSQDWQLSYSLGTFGVTRRQVEDLADDIRRALGNVRRRTVTMKDGATWQIQQVTWPALGGVAYTTQVDPTAFNQSDTALVWVSKNL